MEAVVVTKPGRIDVITSIFVIGFLFLILGAVSEHRAEIAKMVVCQAELNRMHHAVSMFSQDNDGYLWPDWWSQTYLAQQDADNLDYNPITGVMWTYVLQDYLRNPKILFCPSARKVASIDGNTPDPRPAYREWGHTNWAWYTPWAPPMKATGKSAMSSYGINDFVAKPYRLNQFDQANADKQYWGSLNQEGADKIPLLFDSAWYATTPTDSSPPNPSALDKYHYPYTFGSVCLPRHNGGINMLFMDGSIRRVVIKELWGLKWSRQFNTNNQYTRPDYGRWPAWIEALPQSHRSEFRFNTCEEGHGDKIH
jgi:prepilin-type processing-associated H-X9-DG protein